MRHRISNRELGERIGVSPSMASRLRNGRRGPSVPVLYAISEEFDLPLSRLVAARVEGPEAFGAVLQRRLEDGWT